MLNKEAKTNVLPNPPAINADRVSSITSLIQNDLLTPEQTAEKLSVSEKTLAVWRSTKRYPIPYVKFGRVIRYRNSDIDAYISTCMQNTGEVA
jgi:predicted DNA-binding transcriptional regulator AlpA